MSFEQKSSYNYDEIITCGNGDMFGAGNAQLPLPPMLMFDRIVNVSDTGGANGKGVIEAEFDINPDLWFFQCHFKGDPVMPGCLGLDALWQLLGFYLGWTGAKGSGRALGLGELKLTGQVTPDVKLRRVVVTGMGIISCIGNNVSEVLESLKNGKSGITASPEYAEMGFRSHVHGKPDIDLKEAIDKRLWRFMGDAAGYVHLSMEQAIADAGLTEDNVVNERTGIIVGSGGPSTRAQVLAADITREKGPKRVGPFAVPKAMCSTTSATAATNFKIKGVNYTISSACSTSAHCIGNAAEQIVLGKQDIVFAGGGEELDWTLSVLFDAMGAMSSKYNDTPEKASRAYDADRDGFVIAGGGGILVLEEYEHAKARGAKIYAEVTGNHSIWIRQ